ncbi:hypothetical protein OROMI_018532 [Orobanche minor]
MFAREVNSVAREGEDINGLEIIGSADSAVELFAYMGNQTLGMDDIVEGDQNAESRNSTELNGDIVENGAPNIAAGDGLNAHRPKKDKKSRVSQHF